MTVDTRRAVSCCMPCREQVDRDLLEDNLGEYDHRIGGGPHALSEIEVLAQ
ncbi:hypothetical protein [Mycolicibacterium sediminis]|uniref:Uncharacterized protein n=1 Tax=Mycolicibacterium sediminis TaxID=1286180 RepID=A0A7I7QRC9_9MYCO|nr:hypothetical protein [Mycolicibacterium sediminis]BBY28874.1 hypothetical protein MSEDJ_29700 [Mycolicibacterium sediminis]